MSTVKCPKCDGFTTDRMRDAYLESPEIFDDDFHSKVKCDSIEEVLEFYDAMKDYFFFINIITEAVKYGDESADKAIEHIAKLVYEIRQGEWKYVNR